jgi:Acetyltransferase (GNAT) family
MANPNHPAQATQKDFLLERMQGLSVTMLKAVTTAMSVRSPETELSLADLAGGCLAFSGTDVPFTRAIGVGTAGPVSEAEVDAVESFYRSRDAEVRVVISERTNSRLPVILRTRGYQSDDFMQNWWLRLGYTPAHDLASPIEIVAAGLNQAEKWVRTVAAGFAEVNSPVDERKIPPRVLDTFYCLGFANGAQPFFAKHKGELAGGGVLHISGETASIRTTSCRIRHRNQGVQRALLAFRLEAAAKAGCRFAFSSTDQPGPSSRNLLRFGFNTLSTSFTMSLPH